MVAMLAASPVRRPSVDFQPLPKGPVAADDVVVSVEHRRPISSKQRSRTSSSDRRARQCGVVDRRLGSPGERSLHGGACDPHQPPRRRCRRSIPRGQPAGSPGFGRSPMPCCSRPPWRSASGAARRSASPGPGPVSARRTTGRTPRTGRASVPGAADVASFDGDERQARDDQRGDLDQRSDDRCDVRGRHHPGRARGDGRRHRLDPGRWDLHRRAGGNHGQRAVRPVRGGSFTCDDRRSLSDLGQLHRYRRRRSSASSGTVSFGGGAATLTLTTADTFNNLILAAGTKTVAAGTTLTVTGATTLTAGALNGTGTLAAQGAISQASTYTGGTATLLINGVGGPDAHRRLDHGGRASSRSGINKPSGTLTLAGTIRTSNHSWTYTAGTIDPGTSTVVFAGGTVTGCHTLNALDFRGDHDDRSRDDPDRRREPHPDRGQPEHRHRRRPGRHRAGPRLRRRDRDAAHQRQRRPDAYRRRHDGVRERPARHDQQAVGHAHARRDDPDVEQLDLHGWDGRPAVVARGLRRRHRDRVARPSARSTSGPRRRSPPGRP